MEPFQAQRSTGRKTTAFLPSWGGIPTRQPPGSRQPGSAPWARSAARLSPRAPGCARGRGLARRRPGRGGRSGPSRRLRLGARLRLAGGRAAHPRLFSKRPGGLPECGRARRPPGSPLGGQHAGARAWFSRNQGRKSESAAGWEVQGLAGRMTWLPNPVSAPH